MLISSANFQRGGPYLNAQSSLEAKLYFMKSTISIKANRQNSVTTVSTLSTEHQTIAFTTRVYCDSIYFKISLLCLKCNSIHYCFYFPYNLCLIFHLLWSWCCLEQGFSWSLFISIYFRFFSEYSINIFHYFLSCFSNLNYDFPHLSCLVLVRSRLSTIF